MRNFRPDSSACSTNPGRVWPSVGDFGASRERTYHHRPPAATTRPATTSKASRLAKVDVVMDHSGLWPSETQSQPAAPQPRTRPACDDRLAAENVTIGYGRVIGGRAAANLIYWEPRGMARPLRSQPTDRSDQ